MSPERATRQTYRYALSLTSQFPYCGLPLRLDSYSACQYSCQYCFARARGGARSARPLQVADADALTRRFERIDTRGARGAIDELLAHGQPIHLGGMTDPFPPMESDVLATERLLTVLADRLHPTVISTKGVTMVTPSHFEILARGRFILQVSLSSLHSSLLRQIDIGAPSPPERLQFLKDARAAGIATACRIQPVLPTRENDVCDVIDACADAQVSHVAVEHLKLPIESRWSGTRQLSAALNTDLQELYRLHGARRVGREWVLPVEERLPRMIEWRSRAHQHGLTFGAADNDLLLLSDGNCCCSGVELIDTAFGHFSRFTYTEAIRRGAKHNRVTWDLLDDVWHPGGSIGQYMNSRSRLPAGLAGAGLDKYLERGWNGASNGNSPVSLYGVLDTDQVDRNGRRIYELQEDIRVVVQHVATLSSSAEVLPRTRSLSEAP